MSPTDKIIDKIKKIYAKAKSTKEIGSLAEAEIFMAKAKELLLIHNLSLSTVEGFEKRTRDGITETDAFYGEVKSDGTWDQYLLHIIAENNLCRALFVEGESQARIIGTSENTEVVMYLYSIMKETVKDFSSSTFNEKRKQLKDSGIPSKEIEGEHLPYRKVYIRQFLTGAVVGINNKLEEEKAAAEERARQAEIDRIIKIEAPKDEAEGDTEGDTEDEAIVEVNNDLQEMFDMNESAIDDYLEENEEEVKENKARKQRRTSGFEEGYIVGNSLEVAKGLNTGEKITKQLK